MEFCWRTERCTITIANDGDRARLRMEERRAFGRPVEIEVESSVRDLGRFLLVAIGLLGGPDAFERANRMVEEGGDHGPSEPGSVGSVAGGSDPARQASAQTETSAGEQADGHRDPDVSDWAPV